MTKKKEKDLKLEVYSAKVYCKNCNAGGLKVSSDGEYFSQDQVIDIPQGTLLSQAKCPNCGCNKTLSLIKE
jgi:Zn finger protein HypA/HybF involved in hydrogenase expression